MCKKKNSLFIDQNIARAKPFKMKFDSSNTKYFFPWSMISLKLIISPNNLRTNNSKIIGEKTQQTELYFIAQQLLNEH